MSLVFDKNFKVHFLATLKIPQISFFLLNKRINNSYLMHWQFLFLIKRNRLLATGPLKFPLNKLKAFLDVFFWGNALRIVESNMLRLTKRVLMAFVLRRLTLALFQSRIVFKSEVWNESFLNYSNKLPFYSLSMKFRASRKALRIFSVVRCRNFVGMLTVES